MDDETLRKNLVELLKGGQAHTTFEEALRDVDPAVRNRPPSDGLPSVYEELEHMRIAQEDILRYTLDPGWQSPPWPEGYWPKESGTLTERKWEGAVKGFFDDLAERVVHLLLCRYDRSRKLMTEASTSILVVCVCFRSLPHFIFLAITELRWPNLNVYTQVHVTAARVPL